MTIYEWVFFDREQYFFVPFVGTDKTTVDWDAYIYYSKRFEEYAKDDQFRGDGDFEAFNLSFTDFCKNDYNYINCADYAGLEFQRFEHEIKEG